MAIDLKDLKPGRNKKTGKKDDKKLQSAFSFLNKEISFSGNRLKDSKKENFYAELEILLSSGIDLKSAMEIVIEQQKKGSDRKLFSSIRDNIVKGANFSETINKTGKFSPYEYFSLKIGEESGRINEVLTELNRYFYNKIKQRRQLTSTLTYPILVLVVAVVAVIFMMNVIVPMFSEVFKRFGSQLPAITEFIIHVSQFFKHNLSTIFGIILLFIVLYFVFRRKTGFKRISSALMLKIPFVGNITNTMYLARFCQSMTLLTASRTPMLKAIELVKNMLDFYPYKIALEKVESDILKGKLLNESMMQFKIFDKRIIYLTKVAEEVNQLDKIYSKLYQQYTEELEHKVGMLSNLMEPLLIIFVGILVMIILISMYLPLFQLSTTVF